MTTYHISRYAYWWQYLLLFVLIIAAIWSNDKAYDYLSVIFGFLSIAILLTLEIGIYKTRIKTEQNSIIILKGFKNPVKTEINKKESSISLTQTTMQKLTHQGTVTINSVICKNIQHASKLLKEVQQ